jgi:hypothetical protein
MRALAAIVRKPLHKGRRVDVSLSTPIAASFACLQAGGLRVRVPLAPGDDHSQPPLRMATPTLSTIRQARSVSNQLSNYGGVQTGTHPASRGPGRRSIRTQARPPGLLRDEEVAGSYPVTPTVFSLVNARSDIRPSPSTGRYKCS